MNVLHPLVAGSVSLLRHSKKQEKFSTFYASCVCMGREHVMMIDIGLINSIMFWCLRRNEC